MTLTYNLLNGPYIACQMMSWVIGAAISGPMSLQVSARAQYPNPNGPEPVRSVQLCTLGVKHLHSFERHLYLGTYTYTYALANIHMFAYTCYIHIRTYSEKADTNTYTGMHVHVYIYKYIYILYMYESYIYAYVYIDIDTGMCIYKHICIWYADAYPYTYTHA